MTKSLPTFAPEARLAFPRYWMRSSRSVYAAAPSAPVGFCSGPNWSESPAPDSKETLFIGCFEYSYDSTASENPSPSTVGLLVSGSR